MLSEVPTSRPKLKTILANLKILSNAVDVYKLATNVPTVYAVSSKVRTVNCRDVDKTVPFDFVVASNYKTLELSCFYFEQIKISTSLACNYNLCENLIDMIYFIYLFSLQ